MTTWKALAATARAGDRVRFVENWDIFPTALIRAGTSGLVEENRLNEIFRFLSVRPDDATLQDRLADWDGCIYLSPISDPDDSASALDWNGVAPIEIETGAAAARLRQALANLGFQEVSDKDVAMALVDAGLALVDVEG